MCCVWCGGQRGAEVDLGQIRLRVSSTQHRLLEGEGTDVVRSGETVTKSH